MYFADATLPLLWVGKICSSTLWNGSGAQILEFKVAVILSSVLVILTTLNVQNTAIGSPLRHLTLNDLSPSDRQYLDYLRNEAIRRKRSGDILGSLKSKFSQGVKSKLSGLTSASSQASSFFSGASGGTFPSYAPLGSTEESFSFWDLQKAIFRTLFQAAKAIKGGLLAIKGQIIKGSGYVISAKGKLISAKGEALANIGKQIASSAVLINPPTVSNTVPSETVQPIFTPTGITGITGIAGTSGTSGGSGTSGPSGPSGTSGPSAPSGPSGKSIDYHTHHYENAPPGAHEHSYPPTYDAFKNRHPKSTNHGILIVRKIPKVKGDEHNGNTGAHNPLETHKPVVEPQEVAYLPPDTKGTSPVNDHTEEIISPPLDSNQSGYGQIYLQSDPQIPQFQPLHSHESSSLQQIQGEGFIPPLFTPHNQDYLKQIQQSNADFTKLETYDPFSLSNLHTPSSDGLHNYNVQNIPTGIKGLEHFPSYPIDLHSSFDTDAQYSTMLSEKLLPPPSHSAHPNPTKLTKRLHIMSSVSRPKPNKYKSVTVWLKPKDNN
ncbi:hypothetical protein RI129_000240 [Pyrocoelia pectoralis]|uniref:Uncharacterized protein n=1 Tax=Pyrocoelia pectoralis TaxID=417401 RepID=A0AAN7VQZ8_9COLE